MEIYILIMDASVVHICWGCVVMYVGGVCDVCVVFYVCTPCI